MLLLTLMCGALADRTPPDYREELHRAAAAEVAVLAARGDVEGAMTLGKRFQTRVEPSAAVLYELGLLHNQLGQLSEAMDHYDRALTLDPDSAAARYDRGELLLGDGKTESARTDFEEAARLRPDHWAAHYRLAQLAGHRRDSAALEAHLMAALRNGFALQTLLADPIWRQWAVDPELGPPIAGLIVVYGDESILEQLRSPQ
ncbi:MAG: tetratricopeptide (TPR) repeat protein [Myxococcota bacterium]|jgi:tetratricopeptide (TPR) repeat protein